METYTLFYVRPWNYIYFKKLSEHLKYKNSIFFSDHKKCGDSAFYSQIVENYQKNLRYYSFFNKLDIDDIILRDRMLREINKGDSLRLISTFIKVIENIFLNKKINMVISIDVDCYVSDIISRFCLKNKISYYGFSLSLLDKYLFLTNKGRAMIARKIIKKDFENFNSYFNKQSTPSYMIQYENYLNFLFINYIKNFVKIIFFGFNLLISKFKYLNYHYYVSYMYAKKHFFNISFIYLFKIQKKVSFISKNKKKIYIPLQFFPEHNCEYWTEKKDFLSYELSLINLLKEIPSNIIIMIKEHPAMIGKRKISFYKKLNKMKNLFFINSKVSQKDLIINSNVSLTHNGSVMLESVYYNKKTIVLGNSPYINKKCHFNIKSINDFSNKIKSEYFFDYSISLKDKNKCFNDFLSKLLYGNPSELVNNFEDNNVKILWSNLKKFIK